MTSGPPYLLVGIWIGLAFALFAGVTEVSLRHRYGPGYVLAERWAHRLGLALAIAAAVTLAGTALLQVLE